MNFSNKLVGMGVALVTPFKDDMSVDYEALERLVEFQLRNGTDYLVVLGTTGETPTLNDDEKQNAHRSGNSDGRGWSTEKAP